MIWNWHWLGPFAFLDYRIVNVSTFFELEEVLSYLLNDLKWFYRIVNLRFSERYFFVECQKYFELDNWFYKIELDYLLYVSFVMCTSKEILMSSHDLQ